MNNVVTMVGMHVHSLKSFPIQLYIVEEIQGIPLQLT